MSKEIKLDAETKTEVNNKLMKVEETSKTEVDNISTIISNLNGVTDNPEILNIINRLTAAQESLNVEKDNIVDFRDKVDNNLQELFDLDLDISNRYGEVIINE